MFNRIPALTSDDGFKSPSDDQRLLIDRKTHGICMVSEKSNIFEEQAERFIEVGGGEIVSKPP